MKPLVPFGATLLLWAITFPTAAQDLGRASATIVGQAYRNPYGKLPASATIGDRQFAEFFRHETQSIAEPSLAAIKTLDDWTPAQVLFRRQLFEMLSLDPLPARTDLKATITGTVDAPDFTVEKLHFQSRPGLYVTANVYVPKGLENVKPVPAILYVCGHGAVKIDGVSYGNKVAYQHHGAWFARHGYVCMVLDSVQLGEIEGIHHGTHHERMWWWNSRGYTAAGAEAWNCIRALDYLQSRGDVDGQRLGVTGRSGGGAYSWWIAALDERIKAACPVAGITDLQNHVVDGCVEGHCDCMYTVNTYRWDYAQVAALVAPRPLLICNTDKDTIFPLDGVVRLHAQVRRIYDLYNTPEKLGLVVTEGPHKDTQDLQVPVMRWFNKWLKDEEAPVANFAEKLFTPQQLKVLDRRPNDEITSRCYENFTVLANDSDVFHADRAIERLRQETFGAWPEENEPSNTLRLVTTAETEGVRLSLHEFESQPGIQLRLYLAQPTTGSPKLVQLEVVDSAAWSRKLRIGRVGFASALRDELDQEQIDSADKIDPWQAAEFQQWMSELREKEVAQITFAPRAVGLTALGDNEKYQTHLRRRLMLLGATLASTQAWDVRRAMTLSRRLPDLENIPFHLRASPEMTEVAAFAAIFRSKLDSLTLAFRPRSDRDAPDFLNWSRLITPSQLLALASGKTVVKIDAAGSRN